MIGWVLRRTLEEKGSEALISAFLCRGFHRSLDSLDLLTSQRKGIRHSRVVDSVTAERLPQAYNFSMFAGRA